MSRRSSSRCRTSRKPKPTHELCVRFEGLEHRQLFAAVALDLPANLTEKMNPRAWSVAAQGRGHALVQGGSARFDDAGMMQVYVRTADVVAAKQQLKTVGARLDGSSREMGVVQAWVTPAMLDDAALLRAVQNIALPDYAIKSVTTSGDGIHQADKVRAQFAAAGIDGTGVKIGVISDGAAHRANVGAELPAVTVDPAHAGAGDEGTAMLEIVHDLAPGAQLFFAGVTTSLDMVGCMTWLKSQGCNVIVDDLLFPGESYFSDSAIAGKAAELVGQGVTYVTSAGNFADDQHYQAPFLLSNSATSDGRLHRFSASPVDDANNVTIPSGATFRAFLQWSDAWNGSANNYDLYLYRNDATTFDLLDGSTVVQNGNDQPIEWVQWTNNTGATIQAELWVEKKNAAATRELEMFTIGNSSLQFETDGDALIGQEAVPGVISVAAANAASPTSVTAYSSRGGSTVYTNFATQTKTVRQTLDGTAIDGVQTKVGQMGFFSNPFYGTSAAAPHAAAIAALVRHVKPNATPAQVAQVLADTATDLGAVGYDTTSGAGRYDALGAVYKAFTPAAVDMSAASDSGVSNADNVTNDGTPTFTGTVPAGSFVRLFVDGVERATQQLAVGATIYSLTSSLIGHGDHNATVRVAASASVALNNMSDASAPLAFKVDFLGPGVSNANFDYNAVPRQKLTFAFNEALGSEPEAQDLTLNNTTTAQTVVVANVAAAYDATSKTVTYTFPGFQFGALPDGDYQAFLANAPITDLAGNTLAYDGPHAFFFLQGDANHNRAVNLQDFNLLAAHFGGSNKTFGHGDFNYDGNVNLQDFNLLAARFGASLDASAAAAAGTTTSAFGETRIGDELEDLIA